MTLSPRQTVEIDLTLEAAENFGITFVADPDVSVSLINDKGVLVSRNLAGSALSRMIFRTLLTQRSVANSVWKLKIENKSDVEHVFAGFGWSTDVFPPK